MSVGKFCDRTGNEVMVGECGLCWLHGHGERVTPQALVVIGELTGKDAVANWSYAFWQQCRAKNLNPDTREGQSAG